MRRKGELGSIRLALAGRGEVSSHVKAPPGPHGHEPHTWHVPGPPVNLVNPLPHHPSPSQHLGPVPMLGSGREDGCGKEMGLRPGAKQAPLLGKLLP